MPAEEFGPDRIAVAGYHDPRFQREDRLQGARPAEQIAFAAERVRGEALRPVLDHVAGEDDPRVRHVHHQIVIGVRGAGVDQHGGAAAEVQLLTSGDEPVRRHDPGPAECVGDLGLPGFAVVLGPLDLRRFAVFDQLG